MTKDHNKAQQLINLYQQNYKFGDSLNFLLAICHVMIKDYVKAQSLFDESIIAMFKPPMWWKGTAQPNWLVDIYVLSGRTDLHADILRELDIYKKIPNKGSSPVAFYAYGLMELLSPAGWDISTSIQGLLKKPKWKDMYALGMVMQALASGDILSFNNALTDLLKVHEGQATRGGLRATAEGLLCMSAMSLAYVALKRNYIIEIKNDYLPMDYLQFLLEKPIKSK